ncbi:MAG: PLP-dependent aminotransferase family protein, partial [Chloroflexota bacterium]
SAGLHVLAWLPPGLDEAALIDAAAGEGIALSGLTPRRVAPGPAGLIFGYGAVRESAIEDGIRRLADVVGRCT